MINLCNRQNELSVENNRILIVGHFRIYMKDGFVALKNETFVWEQTRSDQTDVRRNT